MGVDWEKLEFHVELNVNYFGEIFVILINNVKYFEGTVKHSSCRSMFCVHEIEVFMHFMRIH